MALSRHSGSSSGPLPIHIRDEAETTTYLSLRSPNSGFTRCPQLEARSPFTRPCRSFWSAYAELIRDQTPPDDFCNCTSTCGQPNPGSLFLAGTKASTFFLFLRIHVALASSDARRAARRSLRRPRCWFIPLAQVCPAAMPSRAPRHRRCYPSVRSEDQRVRVEGPSEGRVP